MTDQVNTTAVSDYATSRNKYPEWVRVTYQRYDKEYDKAVLTDETGMRYILSLKHVPNSVLTFDEVGNSQLFGAEAVQQRGFELVTKDNDFHLSFTNPYKVNFKLLQAFASATSNNLLTIVPDETAIPDLKKVNVETKKFGVLDVILCENQIKLVNYAYSPESELKGTNPNKEELDTLNEYARKGYKIRAVITSEEWDVEKGAWFFKAATAYCDGRFYVEMFPYGFLPLSGGKGTLMFEDPSKNHSLAGTLEDRITSTIKIIASFF